MQKYINKVEQKALFVIIFNYSVEKEGVLLTLLQKIKKNIKESILCIKNDTHTAKIRHSRTRFIHKIFHQFE